MPFVKHESKIMSYKYVVCLDEDCLKHVHIITTIILAIHVHTYITYVLVLFYERHTFTVILYGYHWTNLNQ